MEEETELCYKGNGWCIYKDMLPEYIKCQRDLYTGQIIENLYAPTMTKESRGVWCVGVIRRSDSKFVSFMSVAMEDFDSGFARTQKEMAECIEKHKQENFL